MANKGSDILAAPCTTYGNLIIEGIKAKIVEGVPSGFGSEADTQSRLQLERDYAKAEGDAYNLWRALDLLLSDLHSRDGTKEWTIGPLSGGPGSRIEFAKRVLGQYRERMGFSGAPTETVRAAMAEAHPR